MQPLIPPAQFTRHVVCLGATGSGKTGLCIGILEELALAGVPILAIDLKGDLANLALVFPELDPASFAPWAPGDPAAAADGWRQGLAASGVTPDDLATWRRTVDVQVLTPGSDAAVAVDVLTGLTRAPPGLDAEALREYVNGVVSALLGLIGRQGDAMTDPATILLSRLLGDAFAAGRDLPIEQLIPAVVDPPFSQMGYFAADDFLPREERLKLAKELNAVVTSPAFSAWRHGVPLDVGAWLTPGPDGRTPVRVVYLAHLDDAQRMFFVTLLMHAVVAWSRRLSGTPDLRALVYVDEVFGYLPPYPKNPPSKQPILTLMKQARAVGVGVMLATQNAVDLDYKAMSNAGTWLIGRTRTKQDRARVLDGLSTVGVDPEALGDDLATLPARSFLLLDGAVRRITSRHTMSYLRGPLTRPEVARLGFGSATRPAEEPWLRAPPPLPDGLSARWLSADGAAALGEAPAGDELVWRPVVYGRLTVRFDAEVVLEERVVHRLVRQDGAADSLDGGPVAEDRAIADDWLDRTAPVGGRYAPLPAWLSARDAVRRLCDRWVAEQIASAAGPDEAPVCERDDVRMVGVALVWVPGPA